MNNDDKSFRLDRQARSFRVSDFALRDLPLLALAFVLLTLFSSGPRLRCLGVIACERPLDLLGLAVGFYLGIVFGSGCRRSAAKINYDLSPEVKAMAKDPSQLVAAIKLFRQEHPDVSLAAATERIDRFFQTGH